MKIDDSKTEDSKNDEPGSKEKTSPQKEVVINLEKIDSETKASTKDKSIETKEPASSSGKMTGNDKKEGEGACFEEVENKLEEMFAGIEDESAVVPDTDEKTVVEGDSSETIKALELTNKKQPKIDSNKPREQFGANKKKIVKKRQRVKPKSKINKPVFEDDLPIKIKPSKDKDKTQPPRDERSFIDPKYKGPCIQIKNSFTTILNSSVDAEEYADKQMKSKKLVNNYTSADRSKIRGLHVSTLGNKYDADTADATWICVFCKIGPHKQRMGDLFGPYIVTTKCDDFVLNLDKNLETNVKAEDQDFYGMTRVSETNFEVWLHEDCTFWSPGVFLVGSKLVGLESAIWSNLRNVCNVCSAKGANISCLQRGCGSIAHVSCAKLNNWVLDESNFNTYCPNHCKT